MELNTEMEMPQGHALFFSAVQLAASPPPADLMMARRADEKLYIGGTERVEGRNVEEKEEKEGKDRAEGRENNSEEPEGSVSTCFKEDVDNNNTNIPLYILNNNDTTEHKPNVCNSNNNIVIISKDVEKDNDNGIHNDNQKNNTAVGTFDTIDSNNTNGNNVHKHKEEKEMVGKTPFNVNKWIILGVYMYVGFSSGLLHWGWAKGLREMLIRSGAYEWQCGGEDSDAGTMNNHHSSNIAMSGGDTHSKFNELHDAPKCKEQRIQIDNLWTVAYVLQFVCSMLGGYALDVLGPKISALMGIMFKMIGWLILGFSSYTCQTYIPALMLIAGSSDLSFLPLLTIANIFPARKKGLVISLLGAAKSASCAVPIIMYSIWSSFSNENTYDDNDNKYVDSNDKNSEVNLLKLCIGYIFVGLGICAILVAFLVPLRPYNMTEVKSKKEEKKGKKTRKNCCFFRRINREEEKENEEKERRMKKLYPQKSTQETLHLDAVLAGGKQKSKNYDNQINHEDVLIDMSSHNNVEEDGQQNGMNNNDRTTSSMSANNKAINTQSTSIRPSSFEVISSVPSGVSESSPSSSTSASSPRPVLKIFSSLSYILIVIYFAVSLLRNEFSVKTAPEQMGEAYSVWGETIAPLRFIPCILMGVLADYLGIHASLFILNSLGLLLYLFALVPLVAFRYLTLIVAYVYTSFVLSSVYTYITVTQPREHFGKLTGCASLFSGLVTLVSIGMIRAPLWSMNFLLLILSVFVGFLVVYLYFWDKKKGNVGSTQSK